MTERGPKKSANERPESGDFKRGVADNPIRAQLFSQIEFLWNLMMRGAGNNGLLGPGAYSGFKLGGGGRQNETGEG